MADLPRSHLLAYALVALAVCAFAVRHLARGAGPRPAAAEAPAIRLDRAGASGSAGAGERLVVHVAGAVRRPGVYRLRDGARVVDAVRRAGGATGRADLSQLNLAAKLEDGRQVLVPVRPREAGAGGAAAGAATGGVAGDTGAPAGPVNLNTATPEQLDLLDGVGPAMIRKILDYRHEHGGFSSVEELARIPGIGERRMAALREQVTV